MEDQGMPEVVSLSAVREGISPEEQECWDGFWSVLGRAAYRVWQEAGNPAVGNQETSSNGSA